MTDERIKTDITSVARGEGGEAAHGLPPYSQAPRTRWGASGGAGGEAHSTTGPSIAHALGPQAALGLAGSSASDWPEIVALVRDEHAAVYRYALRLSRSPADAEDLTQETFLQVIRKLDQLRNAASIRSWLLAITRNLFLKQLRKRGPQYEAEMDTPLENWQPAAGEQPGDQLATTDWVEYALERLPEEYRLVVLLYYFENLSYTEVAISLGIRMGTVMSRLSRARERLRELAHAAAIG